MRRVVDRCAGYPLARWDRPLATAPAGSAPRVADAATPADAVHRTAQALADLAANAEGRERRPVPVLRPHGLADQLRVLTRDALAAAPGESAAVADLLAALRRTL